MPAISPIGFVAHGAKDECEFSDLHNRSTARSEAPRRLPGCERRPVRLRQTIMGGQDLKPSRPAGIANTSFNIAG